MKKFVFGLMLVLFIVACSNVFASTVALYPDEFATNGYWVGDTGSACVYWGSTYNFNYFESMKTTYPNDTISFWPDPSGYSVVPSNAQITQATFYLDTICRVNTSGTVPKSIRVSFTLPGSDWKTVPWFSPQATWTASECGKSYWTKTELENAVMKFGTINVSSSVWNGSNGAQKVSILISSNVKVVVTY